MDYYSVIKKKKMSFASTQMQPEIIILNEVNQKDNYHITYMWNLKYDRNELIYKTHKHGKQIRNCQEMGLQIIIHRMN